MRKIVWIVTLVLAATVAPADAIQNGLIAYPGTDSTGHQQIFTIRENGTGRKQLTRTNDQGLPSWAPDGRRLAYSIDYSASGMPLIVVAVMNADGSNSRTLANAAIMPKWSKTNKIAYVALTDTAAIWVMNPDGTSKTQLTFPAAGIRHVYPTWSPDGAQIAYVEITTASDGSVLNTEIWTMNADGTNQRQITFATGYDNYDAGGNLINAAQDAAVPAWCPDDHIYFWSGVENQTGQIWKMLSDGAGRVQLTYEPTANSDEPACAPDGTKVLFVTNRRGPIEMWEMNADGSNPLTITQVRTGPFPSAPSWQPRK